MVLFLLNVFAIMVIAIAVLTIAYAYRNAPASWFAFVATVTIPALAFVFVRLGLVLVDLFFYREIGCSPMQGLFFHFTPERLFWISMYCPLLVPLAGSAIYYRRNFLTRRTGNTSSLSRRNEGTATET